MATEPPADPGEYPAEIVQRAANRMHRLASAATPGPWTTSITTEPATRATGVHRVVTTDGHGSSVAEARWGREDAEYIASTDPQLMLLIAHSWRLIAADMASVDAVERGQGVVDWKGQPYPAWAATLAAGRRYLRETPVAGGAA